MTSLVTVFVCLMCVCGIQRIQSARCFGNGRPDCNIDYELSKSFRNLWDPTRYWSCSGLNQGAVEGYCASGSAYMESVQKCVPWFDWIWEAPDCHRPRRVPIKHDMQPKPAVPHAHEHVEADQVDVAPAEVAVEEVAQPEPIQVAADQADVETVQGDAAPAEVVVEEVAAQPEAGQVAAQQADVETAQADAVPAEVAVEEVAQPEAVQVADEQAADAVPAQAVDAPGFEV